MSCRVEQAAADAGYVLVAKMAAEIAIAVVDVAAGVTDDCGGGYGGGVAVGYVSGKNQSVVH